VSLEQAKCRLAVRQNHGFNVDMQRTHAAFDPHSRYQGSNTAPSASDGNTFSTLSEGSSSSKSKATGIPSTAESTNPFSSSAETHKTPSRNTGGIKTRENPDCKAINISNTGVKAKYSGKIEDDLGLTAFLSQFRRHRKRLLPLWDAEFSWNTKNGKILFGGTSLSRSPPSDNSDTIKALPASPSERTMISSEPDVDDISPSVVPKSTPVMVLDWPQRADLMNKIRLELVFTLLLFLDTVYYPRMVAKRNGRSQRQSRSQSETQDTESSMAHGRTLSSSSTKRRKIWRNRSDQDRGNGDEDGEDDRPPTKKPLPEDKSPTDHRRHFACPFMKRSPADFFDRCGNRFIDIGKLKEHLKKEHRQLYCPDCFETLDHNGQPLLLTHQKPCKRKPTELLAITEEKWAKLSSIRSSKAVTQQDQWREIYRVLFPHDEHIPSPFFDSISSTLMDHMEWINDHAASGIFEGLIGSAKAAGLFPLDEGGVRMILHQGVQAMIDHVRRHHVAGKYSDIGPLPTGEDRTTFRLEMWLKSQDGQDIRPGKRIRRFTERPRSNTDTRRNLARHGPRCRRNPW